MACSHCGTVNVADAAYCMQCGASLSAAASHSFGGAVSQPGFPTQPPVDGNYPPNSVLASQPTYGAPTDAPPYATPPVPGAYGSAASGTFTAPPVTPTPTSPSQPYLPPQMYPYPSLPSQPLIVPGQSYDSPLSQPLLPRQSQTSVPFPNPYGQAPPSQPFAMPPAHVLGEGLLPGLIGPDTQPLLAQPRTPLQGFVLRNLSSRVAVSAWSMAAVGAAAAMGIGLLATGIVQSIWAQAISQAVSAATTQLPAAAYTAGLIQSVLTPTVLQLFAMAHRVPFDATVSVTGSGASVGTSLTLLLPITGLLLIPLLGCVIGGAISAVSDFHHSFQYSVARGALIGPFYGIALLVVCLLAHGSGQLQVVGVGASLSLSPSAGWGLLYGVLWGSLFGALGGWIHWGVGRPLSSFQTAIRALPRKRAVGAIYGAAIAYGACLLLLAILLVSAGVYVLVQSSSSVASNTVIASIQQASQHGVGALVALLGLVLLPGLVANAHVLATGGALVLQQSNPTGLAATPTVAVGFFGVSHPLPFNGFLAVAWVPAVCYLVGGRVAARIAQPATSGDAVLAGAMMAVPLTVLTLFAAFLTASSISVTAVSLTADVSSGAAYGSTMIATLIFAGALGGIGGWSEHALPRLGALPRLLLLPVRPIGFALFPLLDRIFGLPRSRARAWLYDGLLAAVVLGAATIALEVIDHNVAPSVPFTQLVIANSCLTAVLVGLPLVYFMGAFVVALTEAPDAASAYEVRGPALREAAQPRVPLPYAGPDSIPYFPATMPPSVSQPPRTDSAWTLAESWPQPMKSAAESDSTPVASTPGESPVSENLSELETDSDSTSGSTWTS